MFNTNQRKAQDFMQPIKVAVSWFANIVFSLFGGARIRGVDLSHWNGDVDFVALKASGIEFVILKATEGISWLDDRFEEYWQGALDAGLLVMTYHFFRSNYNGKEQAEHHRDSIYQFLIQAGYATPIVWFDVETDDGATVEQRRKRLFAALTQATSDGYVAGYYSSPYLWGKLIGSVSWANEFFGWVAHWTSTIKPTLPIGWTEETTPFWQNGIYPTHGWVEEVDGVSSSVDHNYFFGTREDLESMLGVPVMDCCEELKLEIARLEEMIDANTRGRNKHWKRLNVIEELIQSIKDVLCT
jgi:GH25 family lysozyme M1 (1,4-beta-N-acetylmuramidase)